MKKIILYSLLLIGMLSLGIGIGIIGQLDPDLKHYVGTTEMPLQAAKALEYNQDSEYNNHGDVSIDSVTCPSGNVTVTYDFKTTMDYPFLIRVFYDYINGWNIFVISACSFISIMFGILIVCYIESCKAD